MGSFPQSPTQNEWGGHSCTQETADLTAIPEATHDCPRVREALKNLEGARGTLGLPNKGVGSPCIVFPGYSFPFCFNCHILSKTSIVSQGNKTAGRRVNARKHRARLARLTPIYYWIMLTFFSYHPKLGVLKGNVHRL